MTHSDDILREQNQALDQQLTGLVRTEHQLHRSRRALDAQLSAMAILAECALQCGGVEDVGAILGQTVETLWATFDLDRIIVVFAEAGDFWHLEDGVRTQTMVSPDALFGRASTEVLDDAFPSSVRELLGAREPRVVITLPVQTEGREWVIVAAKYEDSVQSFHLDVPSRAGLPFLHLVRAHCERAIQSAVLTASLRQRRDELAQTNARLEDSLSELARTQQSLVEAQKLEAVGRLAAGVAHDFNNLLTVVESHALLIAEGLNPKHVVQDDIRAIIRATTRAEAITRRLLAFGRKSERNPVESDLNGLTVDLVKMLSRLLGGRVDVHLDLDPKLKPILADRTQVEQVLMNLILNARDAMPDGGKLTISTRNCTDDREGRPIDRRVVLVVEDTGCGMDEPTRRRAFEPFFTTKDVGEGTGLGLAQVYGLVHQNEGTIAVDSEVGRGTTVRLRFPALHSVDSVITHQPALARVLVAEDEDSIRNVVARILRMAGYEVLEVCDAEEAQRVADVKSFDLLLTDVVMPGKSGVVLARELRETRPSLPVIFMSGYTRDQLDLGELGPLDLYISKPFSPSKLREQVFVGLGRVAAVNPGQSAP